MILPLTGLVILAVDDNEEHNYALTRMLEQQGHCSVERAFTGQQAFDLATSNVPNAIILDVNLPDVNGFEICRRLRQKPELKNVPIIFLTATFQSGQAKEMALSVGANTLLFYPVEKEHLFAVIRGQMRRCSCAKQQARDGEPKAQLG